MQKCACKVRKFHSNKVKAIEMNSEKLAKYCCLKSGNDPRTPFKFRRNLRLKNYKHKWIKRL